MTRWATFRRLPTLASFRAEDAKGAGRWHLRVGHILVFIMLAGCANTSLFATDMTGQWSVTSTNLANDNFTVTWIMSVNQSGSALVGSAYVLGNYAGSISGDVSGNRFKFRLSIPSSNGGGYADFTGTVSGQTASGSYTASGGGYGPISGSRGSTTFATQADREGGVGAGGLGAVLQELGLTQ